MHLASASPGKHDVYRAHDHLTTSQTVVRTRQKLPARPLGAEFWGTGRHLRTANREETSKILWPNVDTDIVEKIDHIKYLDGVQSGIINLGLKRGEGVLFLHLHGAQGMDSTGSVRCRMPKSHPGCPSCRAIGSVHSIHRACQEALREIRFGRRSNQRARLAAEVLEWMKTMVSLCDHLMHCARSLCVIVIARSSPTICFGLHRCSIGCNRPAQRCILSRQMSDTIFEVETTALAHVACSTSNSGICLKVFFCLCVSLCQLLLDFLRIREGGATRVYVTIVAHDLKQQQTEVEFAGKVRGQFLMARGVRQGFAVSGFLFAMAFDGFVFRSSLQTLLHQTSCKLLLVLVPMISLLRLFGL